MAKLKSFVILRVNIANIGGVSSGKGELKMRSTQQVLREHICIRVLRHLSTRYLRARALKSLGFACIRSRTCGICMQRIPTHEWRGEQSAKDGMVHRDMQCTWNLSVQAC